MDTLLSCAPRLTTAARSDLNLYSDKNKLKEGKWNWTAGVCRAMSSVFAIDVYDFNADDETPRRDVKVWERVKYNVVDGKDRKYYILSNEVHALLTNLYVNNCLKRKYNGSMYRVTTQHFQYTILPLIDVSTTGPGAPGQPKPMATYYPFMDGTTIGQTWSYKWISEQIGNVAAYIKTTELTALLFAMNLYLNTGIIHMDMHGGNIKVNLNKHTCLSIKTPEETIVIVLPFVMTLFDYDKVLIDRACINENGLKMLLQVFITYNFYAKNTFENNSVHHMPEFHTLWKNPGTPLHDYMTKSPGENSSDDICSLLDDFMDVSKPSPTPVDVLTRIAKALKRHSGGKKLDAQRVENDKAAVEMDIMGGLFYAYLDLDIREYAYESPFKYNYEYFILEHVEALTALADDLNGSRSISTPELEFCIPPAKIITDLINNIVLRYGQSRIGIELPPTINDRPSTEAGIEGTYMQWYTDRRIILPSTTGPKSMNIYPLWVYLDFNSDAKLNRTMNRLMYNMSNTTASQACIENVSIVNWERMFSLMR